MKAIATAISMATSARPDATKFQYIAKRNRSRAARCRPSARIRKLPRRSGRSAHAYGVGNCQADEDAHRRTQYWGMSNDALSR